MFTSRDAARVAATLMIHAHAPLRPGEIARAAALPAFRVQSGLLALAGIGLLESSQIRGHTVHRLDPRSPYQRALLAAALVDLGLNTALASVASRVRFAMVIGSFARGHVSAASDLDLLVVGDVSRAEVETLLAPILERHDRQIDVIALDDAEYHQRLAAGDYLLRAALESGQLLLGDPEMIDA
jgi:predicted nucleotidyltransferase